MEVLERRTPDAFGYEERLPLLLFELAPHPLMHAGSLFGQEHRDQFPSLLRVRDRSPAYNGEEMWLDAHEVGDLLGELRRLRRTAAERNS